MATTQPSLDMAEMQRQTAFASHAINILGLKKLAVMLRLIVLVFLFAWWRDKPRQ